MSNVKCETKYQSSRKRCVPKIPGHVLEKNTRNLYRFFFSLFQEKIRSHVRPHGRLYGRFCRTRGFCIQRYLSSLFPAVPTKTMVTRSPLVNCISTLACKGPVCVAVLTNFYDRFFFEVGQFIHSKSFHLGRHFFHLLTPRFGEFNRESESSGSQQVCRKLFRVARIILKITFLKLKGLVHDNSHV